MSANAIIIGASLGGLIAAAELRSLGHEVTVVERSKSVGGLFNKIATPFGIQELGMHVLYVDNRHFRHLCGIFGEESFHVLSGYHVDVGASANFGRVYFDSHYPSLIGHPLRETVLAEMLARQVPTTEPRHALDEATRRFGPTAAHAIVAPILQKLWRCNAQALSPQAMHCFFDLRRMVVCGKVEADWLKNRVELDEVIANPIQSLPKGKVFGGRIGLTFRAGTEDLGERAVRWAAAEGINLRLNEDVVCSHGALTVAGKAIQNDFDACIVAVPIHMLAQGADADADRLELSISYFQLTRHLTEDFPSYYILAQDPAFKSSRIVNYDAYNRENALSRPSVIAVESVHEKGQVPSEFELMDELSRILPSVKVAKSHQLQRSVDVYAPTLRNGQLFDALQRQIAASFGAKPIYFSGMRTDTGIFFSHHTIGLAYDSALACHERLAAN